MQKKRSAVWRHFAEEGENKVSCRTCHKRLTKHGNTSMMLRHLRGKHPELMHCLLLDGDGPSGHDDTWQGEDPQAEEQVESLPPMDASGRWKGTYLGVYIYIFFSIYLFIYLLYFIYLVLFTSIYLFTIHVFICLFIYLFYLFYLFIFL